MGKVTGAGTLSELRVTVTFVNPIRSESATSTVINPGSRYVAASRLIVPNPSRPGARN